MERRTFGSEQLERVPFWEASLAICGSPTSRFVASLRHTLFGLQLPVLLHATYVYLA